MSDDYTIGDPIFEHGGESEREFAAERRTISVRNLNRLIALHFADAKTSMLDGDDEEAAYAGGFAYRYARELERRRLENG